LIPSPVNRSLAGLGMACCYVRSDKPRLPKGFDLMIEMTFEEATVESLEDAAVIMAVGVGDRHMSNVLLGRKEFARVAGNPALVAETKIVRVKVEGEEQFEELKARVKEAAGRLDPDVKIADVKIADAKVADVKKPAGKKAKAVEKAEAEEDTQADDDE